MTTLREYSNKSFVWFTGQVFLDLFARGWKDRGKELSIVCSTVAWLCAFIVIMATAPIAIPIIAYHRMRYWRLKFKNYPFKKEVI